MKTLRKLNLLSVILFEGLSALQSKHRVYDPTFRLRSLSLDTADERRLLDQQSLCK